MRAVGKLHRAKKSGFTEVCMMKPDEYTWNEHERQLYIKAVKVVNLLNSNSKLEAVNERNKQMELLRP